MRRNRSVTAIAVTLAILVACGSTASAPQEAAEPAPASNAVETLQFEPLPVRPGPRTETTYSVPHVQVFVDPVPEVDAELRRRIFSLPDVERRESITSITGTDALWLEPAGGTPFVTLREREFAHIHPDGSLHLVLPVDRAVEAIEAKWAEFHPWVGSEDMWDGMVMLYTPQSSEEAETTLQLIVDSYNFVTGRSITLADIT